MLFSCFPQFFLSFADERMDTQTVCQTNAASFKSKLKIEEGMPLYTYLLRTIDILFDKSIQSRGKGNAQQHSRNAH